MQDTRAGRKQLPVDLAAGMNTREDPSKLRGSAFRLLQDNDGAEGTIRIRKGWSKVNTTAISCGYIIGGYAYKQRDGTVIELVVGDNDRIYKLAADGTVTSLTLHGSWDWDATYIATFAEWRDDCYITIAKPDTDTAAGTFNLRYDGAADAIFEVGLGAPSAPTAAEGAAGLCDFTALYCVQFYDATKGYYGERGTPTAAITVTNKKVELTNIPKWADAAGSGTSKTIHRVIWRSTDTGTTWKVLTTLENNTTTTYSDNTADQSVLTSPTSLSYEFDACGITVLRSDGIVFFANDKANNLPARAYYADSADEPEHKYGNTTTSGYIDVGSHTDPIMGAIAWQDGILWLKRNSRYYTPKDAFIAHRLGGEGAVCHQGAVAVEGGIAYLSDAGPRYMTGGLAPFVGADEYGPQSGSRQFILKRTWDTVAKDRLARACAHHDRTRAEVEWHVETDSTTNYCDLSIVWSYRTNKVEVRKRWLWKAWEVPVASSEEYRVHAAFPLGFVGRLNYGVGDGAGASAYVEGGTLSAMNTSLTSDKTDLNTTDNGYKGTRITIFYGTDQWDVQYVGSNNPSAFFLDGSFLDGSWSTNPDATSSWVLGMQDHIWDIDGITAGDPGVTFIAHEAELWMGDENRGAASEDL